VNFVSYNKTAKLKGANIITVTTLSGILWCLNCVVWIYQKCVRIILHVTLPTFKVAKLKGCIVLCSKLAIPVLKQGQCFWTYSIIYYTFNMYDTCQISELSTCVVWYTQTAIVGLWQYKILWFKGQTGHDDLDLWLKIIT